MVELAFLAPFLIGIISFFLPKKLGRTILVLTGGIHLLLSVLLWLKRPEAAFPEYFSVTSEGLLSLLVISFLFFLVSIYTTAYLNETEIRSENIFLGSMILFLSTMTMVTLSDHIMVMWIAMKRLPWQALPSFIPTDQKLPLKQHGDMFLAALSVLQWLF